MTHLGVLIGGSVFGMQAMGGVSRFASNLIAHLSGDASLNVAVHLPRQLLCEPPAPQGVTLVRDARFRPWRLSAAYNAWHVRQVCRRLETRVFHALCFENPPLAAMGSVVSVYDMIHEKHPDLVRDPETLQAKARVIRRADMLVALSAQTRDDLVNILGVDPARVKVVYPGLASGFAAPEAFVSAEEIRQSFGIMGEYWVHVGCRSSYKNFTTLLNAFVRVAHKTDAFLLVVGGEPDLQDNEKLFLDQHGCSERVRLVSGVPDNVLGAIYAHSMGLISCSLAEGFGLPLLEAMACGAPVVASDIPVFHEVLGDAGLYFDPADSEMLACRLTESVDPAIRAECRRKGTQRVPLFSWEKAAREYAMIYHEVASRKGLS